MIVKYLASGPEGDIPLGTDELTLPFRLTPSENHPFLTLGHYLKAINDLVLGHLGRSSIPPFKDQGLTPDRVWEILILLILLLLYTVPIWVCVKLARRKNRETVAWGLVGLFISWLEVIILALLPARKD